MKANELRIGNYILDDEDTIVKVECLRSKEYNDWNGAEEYNILFSKSGELCWSSDTFGIPITPEILEKAGFEACNTSPKRYENDELGSYLTKHNEGYMYTGVSYPIIYFHTLQNVFNALTGQELNSEL